MLPIREERDPNDMTTFDNLVDVVQGHIRSEPSPYNSNENFIEGVVSRVVYEGQRICFFVIPYGEDKEVDGPNISAEHSTWWTQVYWEGEEWDIGSVIIDDHPAARALTIDRVRLRSKHRKVTEV